MAFKDKALRRMAEKLNRAGIPYSVGAGWLLCLRGVTDSFHDFDVIVPFSAAEEADRVLSRLGMRGEVSRGEGTFRASYHVDGADIDLCAGMDLGSGLHAVIGADSAEREETVLGVPVRAGYLEDWYVWYRLFGRDRKAELLEAYFAEHPPEHPERFTACADGPLPEAVAAAVARLTAC